jgi:hypothetical protein
MSDVRFITFLNSKQFCAWNDVKWDLIVSSCILVRLRNSLAWMQLVVGDLDGDKSRMFAHPYRLREVKRMDVPPHTNFDVFDMSTNGNHPCFPIKNTKKNTRTTIHHCGVRYTSEKPTTPPIYKYMTFIRTNKLVQF